MMIKVLFVQKCFGMSDPMAEEMLADRISFRRFVGLSFDDKTPDHSTIWSFRERLIEHGHIATLFDTTLATLRERGVVLNNGTLIDATIIEAPLGRKRADGSSTAGRCVTKTVKGNRAYNGYRAHVSTDRQGIMTNSIYDTASVSEHTRFDELAKDEKHAVFAEEIPRLDRAQSRMAAR
jgi:transposase, IS5 family